MKILFKIITALTFIFPSLFLSAQQKTDVSRKWFPQYNFDINSFQKPGLEFGPFARWWWPEIL